MPEDPNTENTIRELARKALEENQPEVPSSSEPAQSPPQDTSPPPSSSEGASGGPTVIRDYLANQYGMQFDDSLTDEQLAPQVGQMLEYQQALAEEFNKTRQALEEKDALLASYMAKGEDPPEPDPEPQQETQQGLGPLEYDQDWTHAATYDQESGRWLPVTKYGSYGVKAAEGLNNYIQQYNERAKRLATDPWGLAMEAGGQKYLESLREEIKNELSEQIESKVGALSSMSEQTRFGDQIEAYFQQNAAEYFEMDESGVVKKDPQGNAILNDKGKTFHDAVQRMRDAGSKDLQKIYYNAWEMAEKYHPASKQEPPEEKAQEKKKRFIERREAPTERVTSRDNTIAASAAAKEPQNNFTSFREAVLADEKNQELEFVARYHRN